MHERAAYKGTVRPGCALKALLEESLAGEELIDALQKLCCWASVFMENLEVSFETCLITFTKSESLA